MAEEQVGEKKSSTEKKESMELAEAVRIVNAAIKAETERLERITKEEEQDPIIIEGETSTGYQVQLMFDPAKAAKIMLDYWYPAYKVLGEEAPREMWDSLARQAGLEDVYYVDI